jgi:hypothetical protein
MPEHIGYEIPALQPALPLTTGNGHVAPDPNGRSPASAEPEPVPAPKPAKGKRRRYSRKHYDNAIADLIVQPRSVDLVLDEIERLHPIKHLPRDLRRRVQIAGLARRLVALDAGVREVTDWMARLASPMRI